MGAMQNRHGETFPVLLALSVTCAVPIIPVCSRSFPFVSADFGRYCTNGVPKLFESGTATRDWHTLLTMFPVPASELSDSHVAREEAKMVSVVRGADFVGMF